MILKHTIYDDNDNPTDLEIHFTYYPAEHGYRDKYGAPETPDYPAYIEIEEVIDLSINEPIDLSDSTLSKLEEACWQTISEAQPESE